MILYYDDNGTRVPAATEEFTLTGDMQEYSMLFNASDVPEAVGMQLGIELNNSSEEGESWIGIDNVRLKPVQ